MRYDPLVDSHKSTTYKKLKSTSPHRDVTAFTASIIKGVEDDLTKLGLDGDPEVVANIKEELNAIFDLYLQPPFE